MRRLEDLIVVHDTLVNGDLRPQKSNVVTFGDRLSNPTVITSMMKKLKATTKDGVERSYYVVFGYGYQNEDNRTPVLLRLESPRDDAVEAPISREMLEIVRDDCVKHNKFSNPNLRVRERSVTSESTATDDVIHKVVSDLLRTYQFAPFSPSSLQFGE